MNQIKNDLSRIDNRHGTINILNEQVTPKNPQNIADNYNLSDYCSRKKTISFAVQRAAFIISFIVDFFAFIELIYYAVLSSNPSANFPAWSSTAISIGVVILVILLFVVHTLGDKISTLEKKGIYKNQYYLGDDIYILLPKCCPKCNGKLQIINQNGTITFQCVRSDNHSKTIDITDLDNLPLEE